MTLSPPTDRWAGGPEKGRWGEGEREIGSQGLLAWCNGSRLILPPLPPSCPAKWPWISERPVFRVGSYGVKQSVVRGYCKSLTRTLVLPSHPQIQRVLTASHLELSKGEKLNGADGAQGWAQTMIWYTWGDQCFPPRGPKEDHGVPVTPGQGAQRLEERTDL